MILHKQQVCHSSVCSLSKFASGRDQSTHKILKLLPCNLIFQISHAQEVLPGLLLRNVKGSSHALEPLLFDDWLLPRTIPIENTVSQFAEVLFVTVFGHVLQELHEFLLSHGFLVCIVLLHKCTEQPLVLQPGLPLRICRVVQPTHHFGQQLNRDIIIDVVVEGEGAEYLLGRESLLVHLIIILGKYIQMGNCTGHSNREKTKQGISRATLPILAQESDCLSCGICSSQFNCKERPPMMLCPNQHNACLPCASQITTSLTPTCPFCRQSIATKPLSHNRILMELLALRRDTTALGPEETAEERLLREARQYNIQRVIYLVEVGADLSAVRELHLWSLQIPQIIGISLFTNLKTLDLHKNCIRQIRNLQKLSEITYLNLGYNQITTICGLQTLTKLQFLDLCHNSIAKIENLNTLKALHTLNLTHNKIEVVQNLYQLPKLTILYLKNNPICVQRSQGSIRALQHRGVLLELTPNPAQQQCHK